MVYSQRSGETVQEGESKAQAVKNSDRLSLSGNGSYSFSNNVTGNLTLGFGQDRDKELQTVSRNIRVEMRAQFTF
jgi:hypothetical protein